MRKLKQWFIELDKTKKVTILFIGISFLCIILLSVFFSLSSLNEKEVCKKTDAIIQKDEKKEVTDKKEEEDVKKENSEEIEKKQEPVQIPNQPSEDNNKDVEQEVPTPPVVDGENTKTITISVIGMNDTVLASNTIEVQAKMSAYDALCALAKQSNLTISTTGFGPYVYVSGINDLKEHGHGASSGWMYQVNNMEINTGAGQYQLKDKDQLVWYYVYS